jgi:hypothetical protein
MEEQVEHRMPVELGVAFEGGTWDRTVVWIPETTRPCNIERVALAALLDRDHSKVIEKTWVQCYGDELKQELQ